MATGKKFYWIKLKKDFMTGDIVDFLMSQRNGSQYVVLYQMLCLMCINTDGRMSRKIGEVMIPFDVDKIQRDCKYFSRDTVTIALGLFKKLGLIYEQNEGCLAISGFEDLIGSETDFARQKRMQRQIEKKERLFLDGQSDSQADKHGDNREDSNKDTHVDNVCEDVRKSSIQRKSIEKESRDKNLNTEKDKSKKEGAKAPKKKDAEVYYPNDEKLDQAFADYVEMRKKIKKPMTERAISLAMSKLHELSGGDNENAIRILEQSIMNSWLGLFPLQKDKGKDNAFDEWRDA